MFDSASNSYKMPDIDLNTARCSACDRPFKTGEWIDFQASFIFGVLEEVKLYHEGCRPKSDD